VKEYFAGAVAVNLAALDEGTKVGDLHAHCVGGLLEKLCYEAHVLLS
jgi:hypothetical protein